MKGKEKKNTNVNEEEQESSDKMWWGGKTGREKRLAVLLHTHCLCYSADLSLGLENINETLGFHFRFYSEKLRASSVCLA